MPDLHTSDVSAAGDERDLRLNNEALRTRFLQAFDAEKIEEDLYHLKKPYFNTLHSLETEDPDLFYYASQELRYDVFDSVLTFKMPITPQHEATHAAITEIIHEGIFMIRQRFPTTFRQGLVLKLAQVINIITFNTINVFEAINRATHGLALQIRPRGSSDILAKDRMVQPDSQFGIGAFQYPSVAIEVGWAQMWDGPKGLIKKLHNLLRVGNGETRVVIGVKLSEDKGGNLLVELSLWRLLTELNLDYTRLSTAPGLDPIIQILHDKVPIVQGDEGFLLLTLQDFASPEFFATHFPGADLECEIKVPFGRIYDSARDGFEAYRNRKT